PQFVRNQPLRQINTHGTASCRTVLTPHETSSQSGCDADVVVFDAEHVTDSATYQHSVRPSTGFAHVIVNGVSVVSEGRLEEHALPGRPVRAWR
ncbi:hypothetical protein ACGFVN_47295, partial [Streptomyces solisilvae]